MLNMSLEIACFNADSARAAAKAGADRIELCADRPLGGTTPTIEVFQQVKSSIDSIPINVMIRPRGGNFVYSDEEFKEMKQSITAFKEQGADGFVFGILINGCVDVERCRQLAQLAGRPCTLHRAFDEVKFIMGTAIWYCGFQSILTSGGQHDAVEGIEKLTILVRLARSRHIQVIVGGGVRSSNVSALMKTEALWYHSSALLPGEDIASEDEIQQIKTILKATEP